MLMREMLKTYDESNPLTLDLGEVKESQEREDAATAMQAAARGLAARSDQANTPNSKAGKQEGDSSPEHAQKVRAAPGKAKPDSAHISASTRSLILKEVEHVEHGKVDVQAHVVDVERKRAKRCSPTGTESPSPRASPSPQPSP